MSDPTGDEFTAEELRIARWIFGALYAASVLLILAVIGLTALAGYWGWPWFIVLPAAAAAIFGSRVIRRYFRNLFDDVRKQLGETDDMPPDRAKRHPTHFEGAGAVVFAALLMTAVAALWYGIGVGLRLLMPV